MKIVYVVESLEVSGGVKVIVEHAEGLAERGHDVSIVTRDGRHDWIDIRVPVAVVPAFDATTLPEADVHVATWFPTVLPTARARRAPRVYHFSQGYEALYPNVAHRLAEIEEAYREPLPKLLISRHLLAILEPRFPGPFHVLPQAIRVEHYRPPEPLRAARKQPAVVGVVGPFEAANKGIPFALQAVSRLRAEGRDVLLYRASQLPRTKAEEELLCSDAYGQALPADVMPIWYHACDLLLHPSFEAEGFPLPPLEAMASGIPVVLTDIPSYGPIPRDAAAFVPPGDDAALAVEAGRLLDDGALWRERRRRGLEVAGQFTLGPVLDRLEEILGQKIS